MSFKDIKTQLPPFLSDVFFETGTCNGDSARAASDMGYKRVITVELIQTAYDRSIELSKDYTNIEFHLGDSTDVMRKVLPEVEGKITFWLDAHGYDSDVQCPLYHELEIIKSLKRNDHTILIDDMRIIGSGDRKGYGWGSNIQQEDLIKRIKEINPEYQITFMEGEPDNGVPTPGDILIAKI